MNQIITFMLGALLFSTSANAAHCYCKVNYLKHEGSGNMVALATNAGSLGSAQFEVNGFDKSQTPGHKNDCRDACSSAMSGNQGNSLKNELNNRVLANGTPKSHPNFVAAPCGGNLRGQLQAALGSWAYQDISSIALGPFPRGCQNKPSIVTVSYGVYPNRLVNKSVAKGSSVACTNENFGSDPLYGTVKHCYVGSTHLANEGATFTAP